MDYTAMGEAALDAEHHRLRRAIEQAYAMNDVVAIARLERQKDLVSHHLYLYEADRVRQQAASALKRALNAPAISPEGGQQILDLLARHGLRLAHNEVHWQIGIGGLYLEVTAVKEVGFARRDDYAPGFDADLKAFEAGLAAKES